jgi:hypothetical protein
VLPTMTLSNDCFLLLYYKINTILNPCILITPRIVTVICWISVIVPRWLLVPMINFINFFIPTPGILIAALIGSIVGVPIV